MQDAYRDKPMPEAQADMYRKQQASALPPNYGESCISSGSNVPSARHAIFSRIEGLIQDKAALQHLLEHLPEAYWNHPLAGRLWTRLLP